MSFSSKNIYMFLTYIRFIFFFDISIFSNLEAKQHGKHSFETILHEIRLEIFGDDRKNCYNNCLVKNKLVQSCQASILI